MLGLAVGFTILNNMRYKEIKRKFRNRGYKAEDRRGKVALIKAYSKERQSYTLSGRSDS